MNTLTKIFSSFLVLIAISFMGCGQTIPDKFFGYVPENVMPDIQFIPTDTLPNGTVRYYSEESILVVNTKGDTVKARYLPEHTSDLIVYKGKHPETNKQGINQRVYVQYYIQDDEPWIMGAGYSSSVMTAK